MARQISIAGTHAVTPTEERKIMPHYPVNPPLQGLRWSFPAAIFGICLFWATLSWPAPFQAEPLALVNGTSITQAQLDEAVTRLQRQRVAQVVTEAGDSSESLWEEALEALIGRRLLALKARASGIAVDDREVDAYIEQVRSEYDGEAEYQQAIEGMQLTEADIRERFKSDAAVRKLIEEKVGARVTVTEAEVADFYRAHMDYFVKPGQVRAAHILIRVPANASAEQKKRAWQRIEALRNRLLRGDDFAMLAIEYSEGPSSVRGGDLGYFVRGQVEKPLADAAFSLRVGEISDIVETRLGVHLVRVMDHKPPSAILLESVRDQLGRRLRQEKINREVEIYINGLKSLAQIKIMPGRPRLP
ncbi:MAG: peptidylprolyl isomerase [Desulfobacterales bacterium]|nr:peptidylprolyl isomerase [Desulfobacterales bacterium]